MCFWFFEIDVEDDEIEVIMIKELCHSCIYTIHHQPHSSHVTTICGNRIKRGGKFTQNTISENTNSFYFKIAEVFKKTLPHFRGIKTCLFV